jgi:hypothetical protein
MRRYLTCVALLIGLVSVIGCSRGGETDKNKDQDRPKPAEAPKKG